MSLGGLRAPFPHPHTLTGHTSQGITNKFPIQLSVDIVTLMKLEVFFWIGLRIYLEIVRRSLIYHHING